jgi:hypothetical protein
MKIGQKNWQTKWKDKYFNSIKDSVEHTHIDGCSKADCENMLGINYAKPYSVYYNNVILRKILVLETGCSRVVYIYEMEKSATIFWVINCHYPSIRNVGKLRHLHSIIKTNVQHYADKSAESGVDIGFIVLIGDFNCEPGIENPAYHCLSINQVLTRNQRDQLNFEEHLWQTISCDIQEQTHFNKHSLDGCVLLVKGSDINFKLDILNK